MSLSGEEYCQRNLFDIGVRPGLRSLEENKGRVMLRGCRRKDTALSS